MKRNGLKAVFSGFGLGAGLLLASGGVFADEPSEREGAEIDEVEIADAEARTRPERGRFTGSRIYRDTATVRSGRYPLPGVTVYQYGDLERTGEITTGDALRKVDPRFW